MRYRWAIAWGVGLALGARVPGTFPVRAEESIAFDPAYAWAHLEAIVSHGPRPPASPGSRAVRALLRERFTAAGASVDEHVFEARTPTGPVRMTNLRAVVPGRSPRVLVISAHYDTKALPEVPEFIGANDSASGLAILLELARVLAVGPPSPRTVWLICFDGEESYGPWSDMDGLHGSRAFVGHLRATDTLDLIDAAINLDMVGDEHLRLEREAQSTPWLLDRLWGVGTALGYGQHFGRRETPIDDDHLPFLRAGIPAVDLIDFRYGPRSTDNRWWHSRYDTPAHCRPESLQVVGDVVLQVIRTWTLPGPEG